jgi:hypothetical protein
VDQLQIEVLLQVRPATSEATHPSSARWEILKGNLPELPKRTEVLHGLFDQQVKLSPAELN